jgi:hypothetical protein
MTFIPDDSVTVVFCRKTGSNAYATLNRRTTTNIGNRFFVFIRVALTPEHDTLGHEFHHVLFNRGDTDDDQTNIDFRPFFSFNTNPSTAYGLTLPNIRVRRRCHTLHSPDPNNDAANANVINWVRRRRTARFPIADPLVAPTATTGNTYTEAF